jgi:hypothetical protein
VCHWDPLDPGEIHPPHRLANGSGHRRSRCSAAHGRHPPTSLPRTWLRSPAEPSICRSQECPRALGHGGRPSSCCHLLPPLGRTRERMVDAASSVSSVSAQTWRPVELPPSSRASARPDTGKNGRCRLASSASSASARPWRLAELPPSPSRHHLGAPPRAQHGDVQQAELSHGGRPSSRRLLPSARPVSRTHGCLLLVGPSVARPAASYPRRDWMPGSTPRAVQ